MSLTKYVKTFLFVDFVSNVVEIYQKFDICEILVYRRYSKATRYMETFDNNFSIALKTFQINLVEYSDAIVTFWN